MHEYWIKDLARRTEIPRDGEHSFLGESDWCLDAVGGGLPPGHSWLITYAHADPAAGAFAAIASEELDTPEASRGWLVGIERTPENARTGRCVVLAGPWTPRQDTAWNHRVAREPWWGRGVDINILHRWLQDAERATEARP